MCNIDKIKADALERLRLALEQEPSDEVDEDDCEEIEMRIRQQLLREILSDCAECDLIEAAGSLIDNGVFMPSFFTVEDFQEIKSDATQEMVNDFIAWWQKGPRRGGGPGHAAIRSLLIEEWLPQYLARRDKPGSDAT